MAPELVDIGAFFGTTIMTSQEIKTVTDAVRTARSTILVYGVRSIVNDKRHDLAIKKLDAAIATLNTALARAVRAERKQPVTAED